MLYWYKSTCCTVSKVQIQILIRPISWQYAECQGWCQSLSRIPLAGACHYVSVKYCTQHAASTGFLHLKSDTIYPVKVAFTDMYQPSISCSHIMACRSAFVHNALGCDRSVFVWRSAVCSQCDRCFMGQGIVLHRGRSQMVAASGVPGQKHLLMEVFNRKHSAK